ncbi:1-acyl-sn-glycerol-3-phosphate acyltransferase [Porphyromonas sp. oral taxon 275]|uniref:1-acyl-sn-glycerol-3-phosphate acyltransferase n=1 Tax=Porphyromonas sp. oral taxon 275 TaxID=712435 RepID=UPI001BA4F061|nr:1-acyl-sn-glycerol-3-phosphate acyltransferase [Porphyromonas sp. oral taxon 275]QUB43755.1 1-acyl-sn-glycerol-3-phosphate acyltransferase [Porphyromonas sp. oral taxon 275]
MDYAKYDDIRPLLPEEVPGAIEGLIALPELRAIYERLGLSWSWEELSALLRSCRSVEDFKQRVSYHWVKQVMRGCCTSVELTGTEQLRPGSAYTYVSNHRDIVLDSAFLNVLLADVGAKYPQIAIGDNLMIYPWVETLVKLNGSFLVRRGLQGRQVLLAAKLLSEYMHEAVAEGQSIWIAQREGRAKDSSDHTQPALLKMLAMGSPERQPAAALASLNIVPVTCSYEYDPCDYLKAQEMQLKRDVAGYKKSPADDGINMRTGIQGWKGRVIFHIGRPLNQLLPADASELSVEELASLMDAEIHRYYVLYPLNYVAYDELEGTDSSEHYTAEERAEALRYIEARLQLVQLPEGLEPDKAFLRHCILTMYANPLRNQRKALAATAL